MTLRKYANTNKQEESLANVERWSKKANFKLFFGTTIGKHPQTVLLDHKYQDGFSRVNREGIIKVNGKEVETYEDFQKAIKEDGKR